MKHCLRSWYFAEVSTEDGRVHDLSKVETPNLLQAGDESLGEKQVFQIYYDFSETVEAMVVIALALNVGRSLCVLKVGRNMRLIVF